MGTNRPARVLVTGGAGFIGSHLVEALVERGDAVTVLDDLRTATGDNLDAVADRIELIKADCLTAAGVIAAEPFDLIFHLAAPSYVPPSVEDPIGDMVANVEVTLRLLEGIRRLDRRPRLMHVSSAAIYGQPAAQPIREDFPPAPLSPYGVDKFAAEEHVRVACELHGLRACILRFFPNYGPRQRKQVVYDLIRKIEAGPRRIEVFGTGEELRDICFVTDTVAGALVAAERAPARGEAYNIGSGTMVTIADIVRTVTAAMGAEPEVAWTGSVRPGDSQRMCADISRLRALGFEPRVSLSEGVARTVGWATGEPAVRTAEEGRR